MSSLWALLLGLLQGITEFLPVSSSGHLRLCEIYFGARPDLLFHAICHLGTTLAIVIVLRRDLIALLSTERRRALMVAIATLPLIAMVPLLKVISHLYGDIRLYGFFFLLTALLLFLAERRPREAVAPRRRHAAWIGSLQALALFPGVSRSGSTIAGARFFGWSRQEAARFSFLLAIPAVLGATCVEGYQLFKGAAPALPFHVYLIAFASSAMAGGVTLSSFLRFLERHTLKPFAWYCLAMGLISLVLLNCVV